MMTALRIVERVGQVYPDAVILLLKVVRQPAIRHEMEPTNFHCDLLRGVRQTLVCRGFSTGVSIEARQTLACHRLSITLLIEVRQTEVCRTSCYFDVR